MEQDSVDTKSSPDFRDLEPSGCWPRWNWVRSSLWYCCWQQEKALCPGGAYGSCNFCKTDWEVLQSYLTFYFSWRACGRRKGGKKSFRVLALLETNFSSLQLAMGHTGIFCWESLFNLKLDENRRLFQIVSDFRWVSFWFLGSGCPMITVKNLQLLKQLPCVGALLCSPPCCTGEGQRAAAGVSRQGPAQVLKDPWCWVTCPTAP